MDKLLAPHSFSDVGGCRNRRLFCYWTKKEYDARCNKGSGKGMKECLGGRVFGTIEGLLKRFELLEK